MSENIVLDALLSRGRLEPGACLRMAVDLADALGRLHAKNLVHRAIRPSQIRVVSNSSGQHVELLPPPRQRDLPAPEGDAGDEWAYISPEQTGRMNREADYRTDFYSLGATLYHMLCGVPPFVADDPLEWVHCHIARLPRPPAEEAPGIPPAVSAIVMKLLEKAPEDRYQSAFALRHDLLHCLVQWETHGEVAPFALAASDVLGHFHVSRTLYGLESESAALREAFERVRTTGMPALALIGGAPGSGKTRLVHELRHPVRDAHAYFIEGRFDPHRRDIPYATIAEAFHGLVRQILAEPEASVAAWRERMLATLGRNAGMMLDIIPQLALIVGPREEASLLPAEGQTAFHRVFRDFAMLFCTPEHPLLWFLDDLQWIDAASLDLLRYVVERASPGSLMLVGAYRDNDVTPEHPLSAAIEAMREAAYVIDIHVEPLGLESVRRLLAETLHCDADAVEQLAVLILRKTGGNSFFVNQFLGKLHQDGLLAFDGQTRAWHWNMARIRAADVTDNLVDLMAGRIGRLPAESQETLRLAACLGYRFDLGMLARLSGLSVFHVAERLWAAVEQDFLQRIDGARALPDAQPSPDGKADGKAEYRWSHERIRQAAYSQVAEAERPATHLRIGRLLLEEAPDDPASEQVFEIVRHLNLGAALIDDPQERVRLAELNLMVSRRARRAAAAVSAYDHAAAGLALVPRDCFRTDYPLALALHCELAEGAFMCGRPAEVEAVIDRALAHARSASDRARLLGLRVRCANNLSEYRRAAQAGMEALRLWGFDLPAEQDAMRARFEATLAAIKARAQEFGFESLLERPPLQDTELIAAADLMAELMLSAYFSDRRIYAALAATLAGLSLDHGYCGSSAIGFGAVAVVLQNRARDYALAYRFGKFACRLADRLQSEEVRPKINATMALAVNFWFEPLTEVVATLHAARDACIAQGDLRTMSMILDGLAIYQFAGGAALHEVADQIADGMRLAHQAQDPFALRRMACFRDAVAALRGVSTIRDAPASEDDAPEERSDSERAIERFVELKRCIVFGAFDDAWRIAGDLDRLRLDTYAAVEIAFYRAVCAAAMHDRRDGEEREQALETLRDSAVLFEGWARQCPANFVHFSLLIAAELERVQGNHEAAILYYENAMAAAEHYGFTQVLALAAERAADACRASGMGAQAAAWMVRARAAYHEWGADAKVATLDAFALRPGNRQAGAAAELPGAQLDLLAIVKALQAISGQIQLDQLLDTLMRTVVESAGARNGYFLLHGGGEFRLMAEASVDGQGIDVARPDRAMQKADLPVSMFHYVRRSCERVLLDDAQCSNPYANDPYFQKNPAKSVLCLPIVRYGSAIGLLYLENRLVSHAFTASRVVVLDLLASQAAISLENARLYTDLQKENEERRRAEEALRESQQLLEQRVADRTRDLQIAADVSREISTTLHIDKLLQQVVRLAVDRFRYYAAFVYLIEEDEGALVLSAGADRKGRPELPVSVERISLDAEPSIVALCARSGEPIRVNDVRRSPLHLSCDTLSRVRSELAIPMHLGKRLIGVLDVQSDRIGRLQDEDQRVLTTLAQQIAVAVRNARLFEEVHAAQVAAESANRAKSTFLANLSHELRTPLNAILGFARMLGKRDALPEDVREDLSVIRRSGEHLSALLQQVIALSRMEAGHAEIDDTDFEPGSLLDAIEARFAPMARDKGLQLIFERASDLPRLVRADQGKLRQVLTNLLHNALRFTQEGSVMLYAGGVPGAGTEAPDACRLAFTVADTGPGIDAAEREGLFDAFVQADAGRQSREGLGIGLAISRNFVRLMGGSLQLDSQPGRGTVIRFDIRARVVDAAPTGAVRADAGDTRQQPTAEAVLSLPVPLRDALSQALERLDVAAIGRTLERIGEHDPGLASALGEWAADFQYERILALLAPANDNGFHGKQPDERRQ